MCYIQNESSDNLDKRTFWAANCGNLGCAVRTLTCTTTVVKGITLEAVHRGTSREKEE